MFQNYQLTLISKVTNHVKTGKKIKITSLTRTYRVILLYEREQPNVLVLNK